MDPLLAGITLAAFIKDLVELGRNIKDSIDQVGENKEQLSRLRDEVTGTLNGLVKLTQGFGNAQPSLELLTALEDLKSHLECIHSKSKKASQHTSWFKSWWNRQKIDQEVKRLNELKDDFYEQFMLFSTARIEGKADQIVNAATRILDTTTQTQATVVEMADTTTRITVDTTQIMGTTAQIQTDIAQVASTSARIEDNTGFLTNTTSRIEQRTNEVQVSTLKEKLEKWLEYPPNMKKRQDDTQELQHQGTGSWFLDGDQFKGWKEKPGTLWIRGDSGTGKSVLSSIVIRQLFSQRRHGTAVAYFYFDFRDEKSQRVKIMLQSIILQLSAQSPNSYSALKREFESSQGQTLPTYDKLLGILEELLSDFTHTYIVLDALDECNEHQVLVQLITRLRDWTTRSLHLLFTSQPREIFAEPFEGALLVILTPDNTHNDIRQFMDSELHQLSHLTRRTRAEEITEKIVKKSNGMFRLAALLLMELRDAFDPDVDAILSSFPDDLFGVYSRFLKRIRPKAVFYVSTVLRWLAFSLQPVTMPELEDALAFDFSCASEFVYDPTRRGENADRVCKMLEGMIVVKQNWLNSARAVSLAHASVEDYLRSEKFTQEYTAYDLRTGPSHRFLAQTCLGYLLQFANRPLIHKTRTDYPLGLYAAENWYYHLGRSDDPVLLSSLVVCLLQDGSNQYAAFNDLRRYLWDEVPVTKPLSVCSAIGFTEAVRFLLRSGADPNTNDNGFTALRAASSRGHLDIVRILLQSGVKVDILALDGARSYMHWDIVQVLLQKSSISVVGKWISDRLAIAVQGGRLEIVQILLEAWTNLGGAQFLLHHPMVAASERGQSNIVHLLLEHGADVNAATKNYNALCAASFHGHVEVIRVLLEKGAEVNAMSERCGSALQAASCGGNVEIFRLLLENGAEVNPVGGEYGSALQAACCGGNVEIFRLLLENGAEVNSVGGEYGSALQLASQFGHQKIVQLLLKNGADVNAIGGKHGNALQAAACYDRSAVVQLLLDNGAEVNATGGKFGNALQVASRNGHVKTVRLLLEKGADVNAFGGFALKAAARLSRLYGGNSWEAEQITHILLENGAHEDVTDDGSEEDVDTDDEGAMSDSSSDDSSSSESDD